MKYLFLTVSKCKNEMLISDDTDFQLNYADTGSHILGYFLHKYLHNSTYNQLSWRCSTLSVSCVQKVKTVSKWNQIFSTENQI